MPALQHGRDAMSMVQQAVEISAPLHTVYEQLAAFENYPRFMTGVEQVTPIGQDQTHWVMDVEGDRREFDARITERSVDQRSEEHTSELQSRQYLVCRLLLEKKK